MAAKKPIRPPWEKGEKAGGKKKRVRASRKSTSGLTETEKLERVAKTDVRTRMRLEEFVAAYIVDFSLPATMSRLGYTGTKATVYRASQEMYWHPYTQKRIEDYLAEIKDDAIVSRAKVVARLWEECNDRENKAGDRIAALGKLAKIKGMEVTNIKVEASPAQGVLVMPMADGVDGWEKASAAAQRELIAKVKEISASRSN